MMMAAAALLGTTVYVAVTRDSEPLQASTAATLQLDPNDPLSALYPHILHAATSHLEELPLSDLIKSYIVYLGSSQSAVVEAGPWMLHKLEWARDNVPLVGTAVWSLFALVSTPSDVAWHSALTQPPSALRLRQTMKNTFYSVFVGGSTVPDCARLVESYSAHGVSLMLTMTNRGTLTA